MVFEDDSSDSSDQSSSGSEDFEVDLRRASCSESETPTSSNNLACDQNQRTDKMLMSGRELSDNMGVQYGLWWNATSPSRMDSEALQTEKRPVRDSARRANANKIWLGSGASDPLEAIGRSFTKVFVDEVSEELSTFEGSVLSWNGTYYHVRYSDGDMEQLSPNELTKLL